MTGNTHWDSFPERSVAVAVTIVVPTGKKLPEGGDAGDGGSGVVVVARRDREEHDLARSIAAPGHGRAREDGRCRVVAFQEEHPEGAERIAAVVVQDCAHRDVPGAVAVEIPERRDRESEEIGVVEDAAEVAGRGADLLLRANGAVRVQEQVPERPAIRTSVVVQRRPHGDVGDAIAVDVAEGRDRPAQVGLREELLVESAAERADLLLRDDGTRGVEEEDPHRATLPAPVAVVSGPDGEVGDPVPVDIADGSDRGAESIGGVQHTAETTLGGADLPLAHDSAGGNEREDPDRTGVATVVVELGSDGELGMTVAVHVSQEGERLPEVFGEPDVTTESTGRRADLLLRGHGAVGVQEQVPERARREGAIVVTVRTHGEIEHTIAIQVAQRRQAGSEFVAGMEPGTEATRSRTDLLLRGNGAVRIHEEDPHGTALDAAVVATRCPTASSFVPSPFRSPSTATAHANPPSGSDHRSHPRSG
jgi:hypothetical protein